MGWREGCAGAMPTDSHFSVTRAREAGKPSKGAPRNDQVKVNRNGRNLAGLALPWVVESGARGRRQDGQRSPVEMR